MFLATELHMTLGELWDRMTSAEVQLWVTYYQVLHEERQKNSG